MRVGNYSVIVPEAVERESGYAALPHDTQYTLKLASHEHRRCDAEVVLDGKSVGVFRLDPMGSVVLERPAHDAGRFTFYADGREEAFAAGILTVENENRGLVQVIFRPEKVLVPELTVVRGMSFSKGGPRGQPVSGFADEKTNGGITGLSGHSNQTFTTVAPLDVDESRVVTISLRLVEHKAGPRPLTPVPVGSGNPVPPPV